MLIIKLPKQIQCSKQKWKHKNTTYVSNFKMTQNIDIHFKLSKYILAESICYLITAADEQTDG